MAAENGALAHAGGADGLSGDLCLSPSRGKAIEKVRVLHLGRVGFVGGAEQVMLAIACAARQRGFEPFLACPDGLLAQEARRKDICVRHLGFSRMRITANPLKYLSYGANRFINAHRLMRLCRELKIDVLHAHHPVTALYCSRAVHALGLPLVLHLHEGLPGRPLYKLALRRAARLAAKIVCVSNVGIELLRASNADLSQAVVIHNGICVGSSEPGMAEPISEPDELTIAVIGVLEPRKGQDVFIKAAAIVAARQARVRFFIVGDTPATGSADYKQRLRDLVTKHRLEQAIEFVPYVANISDQLGQFDVVVSSSVALESLSLIMLEAMSKSCTVVSTNLGGITDVIKHGINGFLAEPGCARSLASSIEASIRCDRDSVGAAARRTIQADFSIGKMSAAVERVYSEVSTARSVTL